MNAPELRNPAIRLSSEVKKEKSTHSRKVGHLETAQQETQKKLDYIFYRVSEFCDMGDRLENSLIEMQTKMPILRADRMNSCNSSEDEFASEEVLIELKMYVDHLKMRLDWG